MTTGAKVKILILSLKCFQMLYNNLGVSQGWSYSLHSTFLWRSKTHLIKMSNVLETELFWLGMRTSGRWQIWQMSPYPSTHRSTLQSLHSSPLSEIDACSPWTFCLLRFFFWIWVGQAIFCDILCLFLAWCWLVSCGPDKVKYIPIL